MSDHKENTVVMQRYKKGKLVKNTKVRVKESHIIRMRNMGYLCQGEKPKLKSYLQGTKHEYTHPLLGNLNCFGEAHVENLKRMGYKEKVKSEKEKVETQSFKADHKPEKGKDVAK